MFLLTIRSPSLFCPRDICLYLFKGLFTYEVYSVFLCPTLGKSVSPLIVAHSHVRSYPNKGHRSILFKFFSDRYTLWQSLQNLSETHALRLSTKKITFILWSSTALSPRTANRSTLVEVLEETASDILKLYSHFSTGFSFTNITKIPHLALPSSRTAPSQHIWSAPLS